MANSKPVGVAYADPALEPGTTITSATITSPTVSGGTVDGATVGASSASTGKFTVPLLAS